MSGPETAAADRAARALMRDGLSDDAIARRTGLSLIHLLELRAAAAVGERRPAASASEDAPSRS